MLRRRRNGRHAAGSRFVDKGPKTKGPKPKSTCHYCGDECGRFTYAELNDGEVQELYCSLACFKKGAGIEEEIEKEISRQVQKECNWLHVRVCVRCQNLIQELHERMQFE